MLQPLNTLCISLDMHEQLTYMLQSLNTLHISLYMHELLTYMYTSFALTSTVRT